MISIFDDDGKRQSVTWNGVEFNDPTLTRDTQTGLRLESVGFSTPTNFQSEALDDIVKNGGGIEVYNPHVGTRVLNMRGNIRADNESTLNSQIRTLQRAFSPLLLQAGQTFALQWIQDLTAMDIITTGTRLWPPPSGLPSWVRAYPLKFTRVLPIAELGATTPTNTNPYVNGKYLLQYHVIPLAMPDPVRASYGTGVGVDYEAQFLIMDGGRSFDQAVTTLTGDGAAPITWGRAPVWPVFSLSMDGGGDAAFTITTTGPHTATALVLDLSGLDSPDKVQIDCRDRTIYLNSVKDQTLYVSGDYPVIADYSNGGATTVAYTNLSDPYTVNIKMSYRESDYF